MRLKNSVLLLIGLVLLGTGGVLLMYRAGFAAHPLWLPAGAGALFLLAVAYHYFRAAKERQALALEKERIGAELAVASRIQLNSLPKEFPPFPDRHEFDIYASMTPAKEVGGDLYDFFLIDEDHLGFFIGDVTGKGVPAALFMMVASSLLRNAVMSGAGPAEALEIVNRQICYRNPEEMFVTVWLGILEISTGTLTAANAGHEYPVLKRADESFELVKQKHGFVLGGMEEIRYRDNLLQLNAGDKLFIYTDGVPEAANVREELFGTDRMVQVLRNAEQGTTYEILEAVRKEVRKFAGEEPQSDDLTMLCLQYNGPSVGNV